MQTHFKPAQLEDPEVARSEAILRKCVHCGFCTATCPTYLLLGDELDSPRGRIYLIKDMLENDRAADARTVKHIDRCLSCLSCMTTCPSGVHYMHLVDHARAHIEKTYRRPLADRALRTILATVLPRPGLFRLALIGARIARPIRALLPGRLKGLVAMAPATIPPPSFVDRAGVYPPSGHRRMRVALLNGCAQKVLDPKVNESTIRLLNRLGVEVVVAEGAGCCGALTHHLGKVGASHASAAANIRAWKREIDSDGLDHVVINTSGCGTTVKDYGHMFRNDPGLAQDAAQISAIACDVSELLAKFKPTAVPGIPQLRVAYHSACSMQHGQKITSAPFTILNGVGFETLAVPESHICCGSAGTYNLLQPELANRLQARKVENIESLSPDVIAAGNLGCMIQISAATRIPVVHTVELVDWATGGPKPDALAGLPAPKRQPSDFIRDDAA
ncbi:MAG: glycolate oxidase subunit GlcF [Alphaproteobacteria bacterium]|nr:glycolate oxidase subunit GlcF [Alphaproteobacteria bacterium]